MFRFADTHPRRSFNGKLYRAHSWSTSKAEALRLAKKVRKAGRLARVVKFGKAWAVYEGLRR